MAESDKNSLGSLSPNVEDNRYRSLSRSRSRSPIMRSRSRSKSPRRERRRINVTSKRVYVCNIPYEMKWMDIKDIFKREVGEAPYVDMMETPDGKPKGACILEFKDKETARKAIETMHRYKVKDRQIVVREEKESDRAVLQQMKQQHNMGIGLAGPGPMGGSMMGGIMGMGGGGGGGGGAGGGGNMSGPNPQLLQNLGIDGPVTNTVFVANLDYKVTWKKLKDVFKLAGNVFRAEIKQDKDGKSRGMGIVQFEHPMEAVQAISMFNGQTLFDRAMVVRMDKTSADSTGDKMASKAVQLPSGLKSIGMGLGAGGQPLQNISQMQGSASGSGGGSSGTGYGAMGGMGTGMGGMGNMGAMGSGMNNFSSMGGMGGGMDSMGGMGGMGSGMNTGMTGNMGGGMSSSMGITGMGSGLAGSGMGAGGMNSTGNMGGGGSMGNMGGHMGGMSGGMSMGMAGNMGGGGMGMGMGGGMGDSFGGMNSNSLGPSKFGSSPGMGDSFSSNMGNLGGGMTGMGLMGGMGNPGMNLSGDLGHSGPGSLGMDRGMLKGIANRDNCSIVVRNLPHSFTWQMLRERFRDVGDVKYAEIKMDGGKSRGWGIVRFATPEDAQRAVNLMNHARIEGREIEVRIDRC